MGRGNGVWSLIPVLCNIIDFFYRSVMLSQQLRLLKNMNLKWLKLFAKNIMENRNPSKPGNWSQETLWRWRVSICEEDV